MTHHSRENYYAKTIQLLTYRMYLSKTPTWQTCPGQSHIWIKCSMSFSKNTSEDWTALHRSRSFLWCAWCFRGVSTLSVQNCSGETVELRKSENRQNNWMWQLQWKKKKQIYIAVSPQTATTEGLCGAALVLIFELRLTVTVWSSAGKTSLYYSQEYRICYLRSLRSGWDSNCLSQMIFPQKQMNMTVGTLHISSVLCNHSDFIQSQVFRR